MLIATADTTGRKKEKIIPVVIALTMVFQLPVRRMIGNETPAGVSFFLSVPHTNVFSTFSGLSSVFNIFLVKCGRLEHPFGFPKLNGPPRDEAARFSDR